MEILACCYIKATEMISVTAVSDVVIHGIHEL